MTENAERPPRMKVRCDDENPRNLFLLEASCHIVRFLPRGQTQDWTDLYSGPFRQTVDILLRQFHLRVLIDLRLGGNVDQDPTTIAAP